MSPLYPDADPFNADWTKQTWDIDAHSPEELMAFLERMGMTPAEFKELPVYQMNVEELPWLRDFDRHPYTPQHPSLIVLETGRWVTIREIEQWETYEGLLAGHPTHEANQRRLEKLVQRYRERDDALPYVIEPPEEPIEDVEGWPHLGTPARMPAVICVARLDSRSLRRDPGSHGSELRVIWLQPRFAFPIEDEALAQIRAIEWERQARSYQL